MLAKEEYKEIVSALVAWARSAPNEPVIGFLEGGRLMTPTDLVQEVEKGSPDGRAVMEMLEHVVRREGIDRLVARLRRQNELTRS